MNLVYKSHPCFEPYEIWRYSKHFEIFVLKCLKTSKCYYYDFSKLLDIMDFEKKHKIKVDRIAFTDGRRAFHFYYLGHMVAHSSTKSILPKCKISTDRRKLEVFFTEIDLFDV